jgi:biofilm PGA synthesis N-glycosyltransferase PgaC
METVFWLAAFLVLLTYFIYPGLLFLAARNRPPHRPPEAEPPHVSFIIAAYNEEKVIEAKLRDTLALDYPRDRLEVLVAADGSDDGTVERVAAFRGAGVICLHEPARRGKTAALNRAVAHAKGEVVVFSDANTFYNPDAVTQLVRHFADPTVGGVTGVKHIREQEDRAASVGDSLYWRYESAIKAWQSRIGSITAADGEILAVRRSLYAPIPEHLINDDAAITFGIVQQGYRLLYETAAVSTEYASITLADDFAVKVRMVAGGFQTVWENRRYLFPPDTRFKLQFWVHKVLRWLVPQCLIVALLANLLLAALVGFFRYLGGSQGVAWRKATR